MDCAFLSLLGWASREEPGGHPHVPWSSPSPLCPGLWMAVGRGWQAGQGDADLSPSPGSAPLCSWGWPHSRSWEKAKL